MKGKITPWFVRLAVYAVVSAIGLVMIILGFATPELVDSWLAQVGSISAVVAGVLAMFNIDKDKDEIPDDDKVTVAELVARKQADQLTEARERAEETLTRVSDKVSRIENGEPVFSVFK